jgi:hypothetical protein
MGKDSGPISDEVARRRILLTRLAGQSRSVGAASHLLQLLQRRVPVEYRVHGYLAEWCKRLLRVRANRRVAYVSKVGTKAVQPLGELPATGWQLPYWRDLLTIIRFKFASSGVASSGVLTAPKPPPPSEELEGLQAVPVLLAPSGEPVQQGGEHPRRDGRTAVRSAPRRAYPWLPIGPFHLTSMVSPSVAQRHTIKDQGPTGAWPSQTCKRSRRGWPNHPARGNLTFRGPAYRPGLFYFYSSGGRI